MLRLFGIWSLFWSIALGFLVGTTTVLPFAVLPRGRRERFSIVGASMWAWLIVRAVLLCRVRVVGTFDLGPREGAILLSNHRSWLDPLLLIAWGRSNGLSKRSILYLPFIGLYGHLAGAVFFDRRDPAQRAHARAEVLRLVRGGHRLQVFPEGTRTKDGELREKVYLSLARDAWSGGLPVVPCAVLDTERVLPVGQPIARPFQQVTLLVGATRRPEEFGDEETFAEACWNDVRNLLEAERSKPA